MRRALPLAALLAAALPAAAAAAPGHKPAPTKNAGWVGVVIAKDSHRGTVVTASADGTVRTLRAGSGSARLALGQRVRLGAIRLADGTFWLRTAKSDGTSHSLRVQGVVAAFDRSSNEYLLSAGNSMLTVHAGGVRRLSAATQPLAPGSEVVANATLTGNGALTTPQLSTVGQAPSVELSGILTSVSGQQVQLAVAGQGLVTVTVPAGTTVPQLSPGAEVQIGAAVAADGSFSLTSLQSDAAAAASGPAVTGNGGATGSGSSQGTSQSGSGDQQAGSENESEGQQQGGGENESEGQQGGGESEGGDDGASGPIGISNQPLGSLGSSGSTGTSGGSQGGGSTNGGGDD